MNKIHRNKKKGNPIAADKAQQNKKMNGKMESRRVIGIWFLVILGLVTGFLIENMRAGLLIGLILGLAIMGLVAGRKK